MSANLPAEKPGQKRDYEDKDIRLKPLVIFLVVTGVFTLFSLLGVALMYRSLDKAAAKADQPWSNLVGERQLPPAPLLQVTASRDLAEHRAKEAELLESYAWIDQAAGTVRIPVTRAMDLVAERGLPVRSEEKAAEPAAPEEELPSVSETTIPSAVETHDTAETQGH